MCACYGTEREREQSGVALFFTCITSTMHPTRRPARPWWCRRLNLRSNSACHHRLSARFDEFAAVLTCAWLQVCRAPQHSEARRRRRRRPARRLAVGRGGLVREEARRDARGEARPHLGHPTDDVERLEERALAPRRVLGAAVVLPRGVAALFSADGQLAGRAAGRAKVAQPADEVGDLRLDDDLRLVVDVERRRVLPKERLQRCDCLFAR
mmetsp:Transcript_16529/g.49608  ORF Transcript_16529/g.49608 Transcript_16529/m.49608 type:complete len:211 (+) Transcript_16529:303-935(+)